MYVCTYVLVGSLSPKSRKVQKAHAQCVSVFCLFFIVRSRALNCGFYRCHKMRTCACTISPFLHLHLDDVILGGRSKRSKVNWNEMCQHCRRQLILFVGR